VDACDDGAVEVVVAVPVPPPLPLLLLLFGTGLDETVVGVFFTVLSPKIAACTLRFCQPQ
jgi:hypothetical protein